MHHEDQDEDSSLASLGGGTVIGGNTQDQSFAFNNKDLVSMLPKTGQPSLDDSAITDEAQA